MTCRRRCPLRQRRRGAAASRLLRRIAELREDLDPRPDHLYGWLPGGVFCGNGYGQVGASLVSPAHNAYGNDTDDAPPPRATAAPWRMSWSITTACATAHENLATEDTEGFGELLRSLCSLWRFSGQQSNLGQA